MSDQGATPPGEPAPRPKPQYGEYAPPGWVSPNAEPTPSPVPAPPPVGDTAVPAWDRPLTYALLVVGFIGMSIGVYAGLNLDLVIEQGGVLQGTDPVPPPWTAPAGWVIVVSHILLYAFAVTSALARLREGRRAFLTPLLAGVIAALIYNGITGAAGLASGMLGALP